MDGATLDKFRKVLGLLSSDHDGERATAAFKATEMLKASRLHWGDVQIGAPQASGGEMELIRLAMENQRLRDLLADAHNASRRLDDKLRNLKREMTKLQQRAAGSARELPDGTVVDADTGEVLGKKKLSKAERKEYYRAQHYEKLRESQRAEREANPRTAEPEDAALRESIATALTGELPDKTREFLASVKDQKAWTFKQREAIRKTLQWCFR